MPNSAYININILKLSVSHKLSKLFLTLIRLACIQIANSQYLLFLSPDYVSSYITL